MYKQTFPAPRGHTKPAPSFVQGTTPVFSYTVTGDDGAPVSLSSAKKIEVTFSRGKLQLKSVQHKTLPLGTVSQQGTTAGLPLDYDLIYPISLGEKVNLA